MKALETSFNYTDMNSLKELSSGKATEDGLRVAAKQLEGVFLQMVLKSMRKANESFNSSMFQSNAKDTFEQFHDSQLSLHMAKSQSLGLADVIYEQLKPFVPASESSAESFEQYQAQKIQVIPTQVHATPSKQTEHEPSEFGTEAEFLKFLKPIVEKVANKIGLNPHYALAQAALETGWGKYIIKDEQGNSSFNLFNIKAHSKDDAKALKATLEFEQGEFVKKLEPFKMYSGYQDSVEDYVNLLSKSRYSGALNYLQDPKAFFTHLQQNGYATDPDYADKIIDVLKNQAFKMLGGDL